MCVFLDERVFDITFWKQELNNEIMSMENETDNLKVYINTNHAISSQS